MYFMCSLSFALLPPTGHFITDGKVICREVSHADTCVCFTKIRIGLSLGMEVLI